MVSHHATAIILPGHDIGEAQPTGDANVNDCLLGRNIPEAQLRSRGVMRFAHDTEGSAWRWNTTGVRFVADRAWAGLLNYYERAA